MSNWHIKKIQNGNRMKILKTKTWLEKVFFSKPVFQKAKYRIFQSFSFFTLINLNLRDLLG